MLSEEKNTQTTETQNEPTPETSGNGSSNAAEGVLQDRRHFRRKALKLNKIFVGEVGEGLDVAPIYLYIVDISEGGLRITSDMNLPMDYVFHLSLILDMPKPLDTDIKIIWRREIFGGTNLFGVQFMNPSDEAKQLIKDFMEQHSAEGKRRAYRLDRILPVEMEIEDRAEIFNTLTLDLSTVGMRISNPFPLPYDKKIRIKLMLDFEDTPVHLDARLVWQKETTYNQYVAGIEFTDLRMDDKGRINLYIDRAISGELDRKIIKELPEEVFDFPLKRYNEEKKRNY
ncbi:MAG: PilZ domain-containing protein [Firmicutes bacterium]|nr:PilZ domain-containing protein [Bacillota bacterium]